MERLRERIALMLRSRHCLLILALLWSSTIVAHPHGHGPTHHDVETDPERRTGWSPVVEPEAGWVARLLRPFSSEGESPLLRELAADKPLVVQGRVTEWEGLDEGRLYRGAVEPLRFYRGAIEQASLRLAEFRGARGKPAYLEQGSELLLILEPTPGHSYLIEHLGTQTHYEVVWQSRMAYPKEGGKDPEAFMQWMALKDSPVSGISRTRALELLAQGEPQWSRHALRELARVEEPGPLTEPETEAVRRVMDENLPGKGKLALRLAQWKLKQAVELLHTSVDDGPVTQAQTRLARSFLGAEPETEVLLAHARHEQAVVRAGAARILGLLSDSPARSAAAELALGDPDPDVRKVATVALAQSRDTEVLPFLAEALGSSHPMVREYAGRALGYFDSAHAADVLEHTVRFAETREAREYAAKLLVFHLGRDDQQVLALREVLDEPELRRILKEGAVDRSRVHAHDLHDH